MIRVLVQLLPYGSELGKREIARMDIGNVGGTNEIGEYDVRARECFPPPTRGMRVSSGHVTGYPRLQSSIWELVRRAIEVAR